MGGDAPTAQNSAGNAAVPDLLTLDEEDLGGALYAKGSDAPQPTSNLSERRITNWGDGQPPVSSPSGDSGDFRVAVDDAEDGGALYDTAGDGFKVAEGC